VKTAAVKTINAVSVILIFITFLLKIQAPGKNLSHAKAQGRKENNRERGSA
jgi:hypothetical protein